MIDFQNTKKIIIPEGEVFIIARGSEILWRKQKYKQELEYLESTGTQYIDTGVNADGNLGFEMTYKINSLVNTENRWGAIRQEGSSYIRHHSSMDSAKGNLKYYLNSVDKASLQTDLNKHTVSLDANKCTLTVDGVTQSFGQEVFDCQLNYWLFGRNGNTADLINLAKMTIYKCQLRIKGVLVRDFIPVLDMNDVPCMYDKVTDTFFYNKGTGQFKFGYKFEDEYQVLDCIESTGTQYIDTGLKLTSNYSVELDYQITSIPKLNERRGLFGALDTGGVARYGSLVSPTTRKFEYGYGKGNTYYQTAIPTTNRYLLKQAKNEVYVDNDLIYTFPIDTFTMQNNAYLGSFNYTNYVPMLAKYYSAKFWDGDLLVRDFIPCLRKTDGKVGMYDMVTKQFFTNKGTGEFLCN